MHVERWQLAHGLQPSLLTAAAGPQSQAPRRWPGAGWRCSQSGTRARGGACSIGVHSSNGALACRPCMPSSHAMPRCPPQAHLPTERSRLGSSPIPYASRYAHTAGRCPAPALVFVGVERARPDGCRISTLHAQAPLRPAWQNSSSAAAAARQTHPPHLCDDAQLVGRVGAVKEVVALWLEEHLGEPHA